MAKSRDLAQVIGMLKARADKVESLGDEVPVLGTIDGSRQAYEELVVSLSVEADVRCQRVGAGGVPAEWITAPGAAEDKVLLYFHGGGYVIGSVRTHRVMLSRMSKAAGVRVLGLDYRLSPENPFPAPIDDAMAGYRWLLDSGIDPSRIAIGGDSAGGGLALASMVALRYVGEPMPAAGVCISPWTDLEATGESMTTNAPVDPSVQRDELMALADLYLAGKNPRAPLASPMYADLHGLPPLLLQVGSIETMLDDSTRLVDLAKQAGVDARLEVWDDMPHVWHLYAPILGEGQQAIERIGGFIREHMS